MELAPTRLVGRDRHLREIDLLVEGVSTGKGFAVLFSGEAGAGKTRLAEEAASRARDAGVCVAWVSCWRNAGAPAAVWNDLVAGSGGAAAIPTDATGLGGDPESARAHWVASVVGQLVEQVSTQSTLFVVDDVQWADPLSLLAVERLVATARFEHHGVVCTLRDGPGSTLPALERLVGVSRHVIVPPLTVAELSDLACELTGRRLGGSELTRLHDRTAGNVLFARELIEHQGHAPTSGATMVSASAATIALFAARVAELPARCQEVLHVASVIGRRFRLDVLAEALDRTPDLLLDDLADAAEAGLVRGGGLSGFEFAHPLVAEACDATGGLPRRVRLHRDVAEAMERLRARGIPIPAVEIAHHFVQAAPAGVAAKAAEYAAIAGHEDMIQLAYEDAARDFGLALRVRELCPADDSAVAELYIALGDAHGAAGDRGPARAAYDHAVELARRHGWSHVLARAALGIASGPGGFEVPSFDDHQIAVLEEAAGTVDAGTLRALVLARLSVALGLDPRAAARRAALSGEAIAIARREGDTAALGYALASWCDVNPGPGAVEARLDASEEILRCALTASDARLELLGRRLRAVALLEAGRIDDFDAEVVAYAATADRVAQPAYSWYVPLWKAMRAVMDGRFEAAEPLRRQSELVGAAAHSDNARMLTGSQRSMMSCELRHGEDAQDFFTAIAAEYPDHAIMIRPALAYALASAGEITRAREIVDSLEPSRYTVDSLGSEFLSTLLIATYASWLAGCDTHAHVLYDALLPYRHCFAVDGIGGYFAGSIERPLGILAAQLGDRVAASTHFDAAVAENRRARAPVLVAGTLRDAQECLGGASEGVAVPAAAPALATIRRHGEVWLVAWNGRSHHLRHTKGMADLSCLVGRPGTEVHVLDLVEPGPTLVAAGLEQVDERARSEYRSRLAEIEADLDDADANADVGRSGRLQLERDAILRELTQAYGLGGRTRRAGSSSERARSAVTQRIRDTITRIGRVEPELAQHLSRAVRTGTFCSYHAEADVVWEL